MKIRVGVFFGGKSVEHEVSVISALQACQAFDKEKYEIIPIYITKNGEMYVGENIGSIEKYEDINALLKSSERVVAISDGGSTQLIRYPMKKFGSSVYATIDVAFPIVHGTNVEDGTLQGFLHTLGVAYVGCDVLASAVGMDKYVMKTVLRDNDIPVLDCVVVTAREFSSKPDAAIAKIESKISYPVIIKPINLGSSVGIRKANDSASLLDAMDFAFEFSGKVLVEHAITALKEINCAVLGDYDEARASECEEPVGSDEILSYEDKYVSGGKGGKTGGKSSGMASLKRKIPADITSEARENIREMAVKAFKCLGCNGVARIDFMIDTETDKVYFNEINTIPGSLAFYLWEPVSVKYSQLLDEMVSLALKRERESSNLHYSFDSNILKGMKLGGAKGGKLNG